MSIERTFYCCSMSGLYSRVTLTINMIFSEFNISVHVLGIISKLDTSFPSPWVRNNPPRVSRGASVQFPDHATIFWQHLYTICPLYNDNSYKILLQEHWTEFVASADHIFFTKSAFPGSEFGINWSHQRYCIFAHFDSPRGLHTFDLQPTLKQHPDLDYFSDSWASSSNPKFPTSEPKKPHSGLGREMCVTQHFLSHNCCWSRPVLF